MQGFINLTNSAQNMTLKNLRISKHFFYKIPDTIILKYQVNLMLQACTHLFSSRSVVFGLCGQFMKSDSSCVKLSSFILRRRQTHVSYQCSETEGNKHM